jgi:serine/threonine protein kinase/Tol biopolymer transport system component
MSPERWKAIEDTYSSALNLSGVEREALLAKATSDIRETVRKMLEQDKSNSMLESPISAESPRLATGSTIGPYKIEHLLGEGGMSSVYKAYDSRLNRALAIKILPPEFAADPVRLQRFEIEARAAGSLSHPNILTIFDSGCIDDIPYLATELLEGETLRECLRRGPLSEPKARAYARSLAAGLAAAHEKGITHRDLKPENVFITRDGRIKILDFGLAKFHPSPFPAELLSQDAKTAAEPLLSQPGMILGTIGYMSPEQARGSSVDHRSDLFNLGAMLYEMVTGRRAFHRSTPLETLHAILKEEPAEDPRIPPALYRLLRHCLEKDPMERFQSAKDLDFDLQSLELPAAASPAHSSRRWPIFLAASLPIALIALLLWRESSRPLPADLPSFRQVTFRSGNVTNGRFTRDDDGRTFLYSASWEGKPVQTYSARVDNPESGLVLASAAGILAVSSAGELALMLGCRIYYGVCRGTIARMPSGGGAPREIQQDGDWADWDSSGNLAIVRQHEGKSRIEYPVGNVLYENPTGWISYLRFSPKGDRIAFLDHPKLDDNDGSVELIDLKATRVTLASARKGLKGLAWSPSGDEVWFSSGSPRVPVLSAVTPTGKQRVVWRSPGWTEILDIAPGGRVLLLRQNPRSNMVFGTTDSSPARDVSWFDWSTTADLSPDGKSLLFYEWGEAAQGTPRVYVRTSDAGEAILLGEGKALALSPDQKWVLAQTPTKPPSLILYPTGSGQPIRLSEPGMIEFYSATWFPDGSRILFSGEHSTHGIRTFTQDIKGGDVQPLTPQGVRATLVSPSGDKLAAYGPMGELLLLLAGGSNSTPIRGAEPGDELVQWSADGGYIFVRSAVESSIHLYRLSLTGAERRLWKKIEVPDHTGLINIESTPGAIRLTPDGKFFAFSYWKAQGEIYVAEGLK